MSEDQISSIDGKGPKLVVTWNKNALVGPNDQAGNNGVLSGEQQEVSVERWGVNGSERVSVFNNNPNNYAYLDPGERSMKKIQIEFTGWGRSDLPIQDENGQPVRGLAVEFFRADTSDGNNLFRLLGSVDTQVSVYDSKTGKWVVAQSYDDGGIKGEVNRNMPILKDIGEVYSVAVQNRTGSKVYEVRLNKTELGNNEMVGSQVRKDESGNMLPNSRLEIREKK